MITLSFFGLDGIHFPLHHPGLIDAAMALPDKPEGWYHCQWPVPGGLLTRWKSSYVRRVTALSGNHCVVGSDVYSDRTERALVEHAVKDTLGQIEQPGAAAFPCFHDATGPFIAKELAAGWSAAPGRMPPSRNLHSPAR